MYDAFGNRTSMTVGMDTTTYAYDDADRLTSVTPPGQSAIAYTWDDNGNLTDRGSDDFDWDYEDRMVSATVDSATTTFAYRGDGLRDSRTFNSNTTTFTWDIAAGLPVVIDDEGARYVYGAGLVSQVTSGESYYYLTDGIGSTMATVDSDGDVVNEYTYDVFGETRSESGAQANEFQFAGEQVDGSTGLQYLRARYYDMETGRFISRDPIAIQPGWGESAYGYAGANPILYRDPTGLCRIYDIPCWVQALSNLNDAEFAYCHRGPKTLKLCLQAVDESNHAINEVVRVFGDREDGVTDAFRHCLWSGFMVCRFGSGQAKIFGDLHEMLPEQNPSRGAMGLHNNRVGRTIGEYYRGRPNARALISQECLKATYDGRLITNQTLFDKGAWDAFDGNISGST